MIRRGVELLLIVAVLVGGALAWLTGRERAWLETERDRLARAAGDLTITDPSKIHIVALETGAPLHYAWRVYLPPLHGRHKLKFHFLYGSSEGLGSYQEFVTRVWIGEDAKGRLNLFEDDILLSYPLFDDERLADLVRGHEGEILVEQMGSSGVVVVDPDQPAVLLKLRLPQGLLAKARETLDPHSLNQLTDSFLRIELVPGPP